jgi:hypothetical protein
MIERVWDRFLTEQNKAILGNKQPRPIGILSSIQLLDESAFLDLSKE